MSSHAAANSASVASSAQAVGKVQRHKAVDRIYHWVMAICILTLLATSLLPIVGWKFAWLTIHWITGLVLTVGVIFHIIRALFFQDPMSMVVDTKDVANLTAGGRPGKYNMAQKLYHLAIAILILCGIGSGLLMLRKIDTPFWQRNAYWFGDQTWGFIYAIHDLVAMSLVTMIMIHIYFALRPDEWFLTRSMFRGWISRKEYRDHFDSKRWKAKEEP